MKDFKSFIKGIKAMKVKTNFFKPKYWEICIFKYNMGWWLNYFTPVWHDGRGPYLSIGLLIIVIYRGY